MIKVASVFCFNREHMIFYPNETLNGENEADGPAHCLYTRDFRTQHPKIEPVHLFPQISPSGDHSPSLRLVYMLPNTNKKYPFMIITDDAFPFWRHFMKPYGAVLGAQEAYFQLQIVQGKTCKWKYFWDINSSMEDIQTTN